MEPNEILPKWKQNLAMELYWTNLLLSKGLITSAEVSAIKEAVRKKYDKEEHACSSQSE